MQLLLIFRAYSRGCRY